MTPPPSSAAASFCDAAAILPSLYLATARVLPRPAVASRLVDAPDAAPPRPAIAPAIAPDAAPPRLAVTPAIALLSCCYRAAIVPIAAIALLSPVLPSPYRPIAGSTAPRPIALCHHAAPRPAVAPEVVLQDKQRSGVALPRLAVALPTAIALPLSRYRPSPAVIPLSSCCHLPGGHPAAIDRRSPCCHRPAVVVLLGLPALPSSAAAPCCLAVALPCHSAIVDLSCRVDSYSIVAGSSSRLLIFTWPSLPPCRQLLRSLSLLNRWGCPGNPGSTLL